MIGVAIPTITAQQHIMYIVGSRREGIERFLLTEFIADDLGP